MSSRTLVAALALLLGCGRGSSGERASAAVVEGARVPDAEVTGTSGTKVALAELLHQHARSVVVFHRGLW